MQVRVHREDEIIMVAMQAQVMVPVGDNQPKIPISGGHNHHVLVLYFPRSRHQRGVLRQRVRLVRRSTRFGLHPRLAMNVRLAPHFVAFEIALAWTAFVIAACGCVRRQPRHFCSGLNGSTAVGRLLFCWRSVWIVDVLRWVESDHAAALFGVGGVGGGGEEKEDDEHGGGAPAREHQAAARGREAPTQNRRCPIRRVSTED